MDLINSLNSPDTVLESGLWLESRPDKWHKCADILNIWNDKEKSQHDVLTWDNENDRFGLLGRDFIDLKPDKNSSKVTKYVLNFLLIISKLIGYFSSICDKRIIDLKMASLFQEIDWSVDEIEIENYLLAKSKFPSKCVETQKLIDELNRLNRISNVFIEGLTKIHKGKKKKDSSYSDSAVEAILRQGERMHLKILNALELLQEKNQ
jgi:hypothetical protein